MLSSTRNDMPSRCIRVRLGTPGPSSSATSGRPAGGSGRPPTATTAAPGSCTAGSWGTDGEQGHPRHLHGPPRRAVPHPRAPRDDGDDGRLLRPLRRVGLVDARAGRRARRRPLGAEERGLHGHAHPRRGGARHTVEALPRGEGEALPRARLADGLDRPRRARRGRGAAAGDGLRRVPAGDGGAARSGARQARARGGAGHGDLRRPESPASTTSGCRRTSGSASERGRCWRSCGRAGSTCRTRCARASPIRTTSRRWSGGWCSRRRRRRRRRSWTGWAADGDLLRPAR